MSFIKDKEYAKNICKSNQDKKQCSFLGVTANGFECWKESVIKTQIDKKRTDGKITAMGNYCIGYEKSKK